MNLDADYIEMCELKDKLLKDRIILSKQVELLEGTVKWCDRYTESHGMGTVIIKDALKTLEQMRRGGEGGT